MQISCNYIILMCSKDLVFFFGLVASSTASSIFTAWLKQTSDFEEASLTSTEAIDGGCCFFCGNTRMTSDSESLLCWAAAEADEADASLSKWRSPFWGITITSSLSSLASMIIPFETPLRLLRKDSWWWMTTEVNSLFLLMTAGGGLGGRCCAGWLWW